MSGICQKLCIDDLCRGNPDDTLCGGSYCEDCRGIKCHDDSLCDECREQRFDDGDDWANDDLFKN